MALHCWAEYNTDILADMSASCGSTTKNRCTQSWNIKPVPLTAGYSYFILFFGFRQKHSDSSLSWKINRAEKSATESDGWASPRWSVRRLSSVVSIWGLIESGMFVGSCLRLCSLSDYSDAFHFLSFWFAAKFEYLWLLTTEILCQ